MHELGFLDERDPGPDHRNRFPARARGGAPRLTLAGAAVPYLGTCVTQPRTIDTLAVIVPFAVAHADPWRMMSVGIFGLS